MHYGYIQHLYVSMLLAGAIYAFGLGPLVFFEYVGRDRPGLGLLMSGVTWVAATIIIYITLIILHTLGVICLPCLNGPV